MYGGGPYPTIMVLHPGSWKYMDKGYGSMSTASQYLAAQGNVVFDLQYGAQEEEGVGKENQETMLGIVRNIAGFTTWLANTTSTPWEDAPLGEGGQQITGRYNADLRNIVSLGRSAGAHLASLTSLSYQNSTWESYDVHWAPEVRYTGSITYYSPMNPTLFTDALDPSKYGDTELYRDMNSTDDMYMISPYHHLKTASPPVLQLIGTEDNYGLYNVNVAFKKRAEQLGTKCVLLTFKGSDHSYDAIPTHPPTQISLWAVERFLQLCREEGQ